MEVHNLNISLIDKTKKINESNKIKSFENNLKSKKPWIFND